MIKKYFAIILFFVLNLNSQDLKKSLLSNPINDFENKLSASKKMSSKNENGFDAVVNPEKYYLGPNDEIEINIWQSPPLSYNLIISPEGTILIPFVGEVYVAELKLSEAKKKIKELIKKKYLTGDVSITLTSPRTIIVTILGQVVNPGKYILKSTDRTDLLIQMANEEKKIDEKTIKSEIKSEIKEITEDYSKRNISITGRNNRISNVDLVKYYATKNEDLNPYLREGDVVIVPKYEYKKNVVAVYGEVKNPGQFEFVKNETLFELVQLAHGFTEKAQIENIEFYRLDLNGKKITQKIIDGNDILSKKENFIIESGDRIIVKQKIDLREDFIVEVKGEVFYPGKYPISKDGIFLSEIINMAGGITKDAFLESATILRKTIKSSDFEIEKLLSSRNYVKEEDSVYYQIESRIKLSKEIVTADFYKILIEKNKDFDVMLLPGDIIEIQRDLKSIYIFGQVSNPGYLSYIKNQNVEYYINKAGGFTNEAREGDLRIIKAKTKQWLDEDETTIESGDMIWVPKKIKYEFKDYAIVSSQIASIFSVILSMIIILKSN